LPTAERLITGAIAFATAGLVRLTAPLLDENDTVPVPVPVVGTSIRPVTGVWMISPPVLTTVRLPAGTNALPNELTRTRFRLAVPPSVYVMLAVPLTPLAPVVVRLTGPKLWLAFVIAMLLSDVN